MREVLLIALVVLLFFGSKKIPELMKGLSKGSAFVQGRDARYGKIENEPVKKE